MGLVGPAVARRRHQNAAHHTRIHIVGMLRCTATVDQNTASVLAARDKITGVLAVVIRGHWHRHCHFGWCR